MFELFRNWITAIVVAVIFMALVDVILPSNSLKKYAKLVMGLIIIIIIMTPIFKLFDRNTNIDDVINKYMNKYDNIGSSNIKNVQNNFDEETLTIFKENLKTKIEENIYNDLNKKYSVTSIKIDEDPSSKYFSNVSYIELKNEDNDKKIRAVSKITLGGKTEVEDGLWNKDVVNILKSKFNIKASVIKFIK